MSAKTVLFRIPPTPVAMTPVHRSVLWKLKPGARHTLIYPVSVSSVRPIIDYSVAVEIAAHSTDVVNRKILSASIAIHVCESDPGSGIAYTSGDRCRLVDPNDAGAAASYRPLPLEATVDPSFNCAVSVHKKILCSAISIQVGELDFMASASDTCCDLQSLSIYDCANGMLKIAYHSCRIPNDLGQVQSLCRVFRTAIDEGSDCAIGSYPKIVL